MAKKRSVKPVAWIVYILECADKTLYTGITNDLESRLAKHAKGIGAKYTRGRDPYKVVYSERHRRKGRALKREAEIKSLGREAKLRLAAAWSQVRPCQQTQ